MKHAVTVGIAILCAAALAGCGSDDEPSGFNGGGTCAPGEAVQISDDGASPIIEGDCGAVTVTASNVSGNVQNASSVSVKGSGTTLLGKKWAEATVSGSGAAINVDELETATVAGDFATVSSERSKTVTVDGQTATVNISNVDRLVLNGNGATVVVSGTIGSLEVHGNDNTVNWSRGAQKPSVDTGSGNKYTR